MGELYKKNLERIAINSEVRELQKELHGMFDKKIVKACDRIHVAIGYGMGNVIIIDTEEGLVIVDTSDGCKITSQIKKDAGNLLSKPVRKIIYTHNHGDHWAGTAEFMSPETEVIAQNNFMEVVEYNKRLMPKLFREANLQFSLDLPPEQRHIKLNLDNPKEAKWVLPNVLFDQSHMFTLGGLDFELYHIESETHDHLMVWIPQLGAVCTGDLYYPSFPAISSPMKRVRSAYKWYRSVERTINLEPEYLIPSHTLPVAGKGRIAKILSNYRDAIKHIDDEVIRGLNEGKTLEDMRNSITLPARLKEKPYLHEMYGEVSWAVEGVFRVYSGWYEGNPTWLDPLPARKRNADLVELAGADKILKRAEEYQERNEHQLALELCETVLSVEPDNESALKIKIFSLQSLGLNSINSNTRGFYLGEAARLSNRLQNRSHQQQ